MAKLCEDCKGRGRWVNKTYIKDEIIETWFDCNTCHGTGKDQDPEDGDDFDIGGDSYAEDA